MPHVAEAFPPGSDGGRGGVLPGDDALSGHIVVRPGVDGEGVARKDVSKRERVVDPSVEGVGTFRHTKGHQLVGAGAEIIVCGGQRSDIVVDIITPVGANGPMLKIQAARDRHSGEDGPCSVGEAKVSTNLSRHVPAACICVVQKVPGPDVDLADREKSVPCRRPRGG